MEAMQANDSESLDQIMKKTLEEARRDSVLRRNIVRKLYTRLPVEDLVLYMDDTEESRRKRSRLSDIIVQVIAEMNIDTERERKLHREILDGVISYGPIAEFIYDMDVTEIMVNHREQIFIEKSGRLELTDRHFVTTEHLLNVIQ